MRLVAKKMRKAAADMEADMVDVRKEDEALKKFEFPFSKLIGQWRPPPPTTLLFVNSETRMGGTDHRPPWKGGRRTPSVSSRFGSKLPHYADVRAFRWLIIMTGHGPLITIDKVSIRHPETGDMVVSTNILSNQSLLSPFFSVLSFLSFLFSLLLQEEEHCTRCA